MPRTAFHQFSITANKVTISRILLIPFFVVELSVLHQDRERVIIGLWGFVTFAVASILTRWMAGIARHN